MRNRYLIAYDIADDKRRTKVFELLESNGDHVQYSVFVCELNTVELQKTKGELIELINLRQDQVIVLNMGPVDSEISSRLTCLGKAYSPPCRVQVV